MPLVTFHDPPPPRSSIEGRSATLSWNTAPTLTANAADHSGSVTVTVGPSGGPARRSAGKVEGPQVMHVIRTQAVRVAIESLMEEGEFRG